MRQAPDQPELDAESPSPGTDARLPSNDAGDGIVTHYRPELDAVRFMAFFFVFMQHFLFFSPRYMRTLSPVSQPIAWHARMAIGETGAMGLPLFFCLSAFLITCLLMAERDRNGAISVKRFYVRRILRIWPLYFVGIAIGISIALMIHRPADVHAFLWCLVFAGNIYCGIFGWPLNPLAPLWSISVEEQFYLVWPWAIRWFSRKNLAVCALGFIAIANIALFWMGQMHAEKDTTVWSNTLVQFQMFAVGILLALRKQSNREKNPILGFAFVAGGIATWLVSSFIFQPNQIDGRASSGINLIAGYGLVAFGCAAILHGFCQFPATSIPSWLSGLGKISYGLYVFHNLGIDFAEVLFRHFSSVSYWTGRFSVAFLLTVTIAMLSYEYIEKPFLRLKRRFEFLHTRPI